MNRQSAEPLIRSRFLSPEILARIASLELVARTVVEGFLSGLHQSPYIGFSVDFVEYRPYVPGDDIRYVDWKVLARTDRYYIKKFEGDTNTRIHLLVDVSGSMGYRSGPVTKLEYALYLAAALAYLAHRQQDAVGLVAFDRDIRSYLPPRLRPGHLRLLLTTLEHLRPSGPSAIADMLVRIAELIQKRGFIVVISDLYEDAPRLTDALRRLRCRGHDLIVFHVLDARELSFDFSQPGNFVDMETGAELQVSPEDLRAAYERAVHEHITSLRHACEGHRIDYQVVSTSQPLDYALFEYLSRRSHLR
ncbi:MAG TPA: DUF58 domain-containing protein [Blastocatellia bacterium]|nr:DUF58 domain-containing protein [Blastocatellia bacterium]